MIPGPGLSPGLVLSRRAPLYTTGPQRRHPHPSKIKSENWPSGSWEASEMIPEVSTDDSEKQISRFGWMSTHFVAKYCENHKALGPWTLRPWEPKNCKRCFGTCRTGVRHSLGNRKSAPLNSPKTQCILHFTRPTSPRTQPLPAAPLSLSLSLS